MTFSDFKNTQTFFALGNTATSCQWLWRLCCVFFFAKLSRYKLRRAPPLACHCITTYTSGWLTTLYSKGSREASDWYREDTASLRRSLSYLCQLFLKDLVIWTFIFNRLKLKRLYTKAFEVNASVSMFFLIKKWSESIAASLIFKERLNLTLHRLH